MKFGYITFKSVSYAMKFEAELKKFNIKTKIIPVPRSISSSCGLCIRFDLNDLEEMLSIIDDNKLDYSKIYTDIVA